MGQGITFRSTTIFYESFRRLCIAYPSLKSDFSDEFKGLTIEQIFSKKYILKDSGVVKIIKVRIANSNQNKGKSSGFRVIVLVDIRTAEVTLLNIFAKTGVSGKENIDKEEVKESLTTWKEERNANSLITLDPEKDFDAI